MKKLSLLFAGLLLAGSPTTAQTSLELGPGPAIIVSQSSEAQPEIVNVFVETQSPYFHDPQAPRFMLIDSKGKWGLGIGGFIRSTIEYDFDKIVSDKDFYPSYIPSTGKPASSQTQFDISTSTVYMKLVGKTNSLGDFIVYTAGNWRGDGNTFQLLNAYMTFLGFTFGYSTGMFMDLTAAAPTIDYAGPAGMTFYRSTQFSWSHKLKSGLSFGIGTELPDVSGTDNTYASVAVQRFPDVTGFLQFRWTERSHVRLGGVMRSITYDNLVEKKDKEQVGWGAQASTKIAFGDNLSLFGQYTIGEGIGELLNDISNLSVDIVPNPKNDGSMMLLLMDGWYAGMRYNLRDNMFVSATYSQSSLHSKNGYSANNPLQYKRGQYVVGNLFWNVTPSVQLGIEYLHGWRVNFDNKTYNANRVNISSRFDF